MVWLATHLGAVPYLMLFNNIFDSVTLIGWSTGSYHIGFLHLYLSCSGLFILFI